MAVQWTIRDRKGRLTGPFSTEDILGLIAQGLLVGNEKISVYPNGDWQGLSTRSEFFDALLDTIKNEGPARSFENESITSDAHKRSLHTGDQETVVPPPPEEGPPLLMADHTGQLGQSPNILDLTDVEKINDKEKKKQRRRPLFFFLLGIIFVVGYFLWSPSGSQSGHLLRPVIHTAQGIQSLPPRVVQEKLQASLKYFISDTHENYLLAQNQLVQIIEDRPHSSEAYELLCMTYRELWPFVSQRAEDLETVQFVEQTIRQAKPSSRAADVCHLVSVIVKGSYKEAQQSAANILRLHPDYVFVNEIMGDLEAARKSYRTAVYYFGQARELWQPPPRWLKPLVAEAKWRTQLSKAGETNEAALAVKLYELVLRQNPQHGVALIEKASLEFEVFKHSEKAESLVTTAFALKKKIPPMVEAEGYFLLAQISKRRGDMTNALAHAQSAFKVFPGHLESRQMVIELGGAEKLKDMDAAHSELLFVGDQYVKAGNCFAAQAEFKAAYAMDNKNGLAAMKAGQCLWELHQSEEAIDWLKKAITSDSHLISAYTMLADFMSDRFDYVGASKVLQTARRLAPKSPDIFRGFAQVELRRQDYKRSIEFAKRANQLYENDLKTVLILAQSYLALEQFNEALAAASKAVEIEPNNLEGQVIYGKVVTGLKGLSTAISFFRQKIEAFPQIAGYRYSLAELYLRDERYSEAEAVLKQTLALDPSHKPALLLLGKVLQIQRRYSEALENFLTASTLDPADAEPLFLTGQLYLNSGQPGRAIEKFQRVAKINKNYPLVYYSIGQAKLRTKDYQGALDSAEDEKSINPQIAEPYLLAAETHTELKQFAQCATEYQKAIERGAKTAGVYVLMAKCYRQTGAIEVAQSMLEQAASIESGMPDIYREQGALYQTQNEFEKALEAYGRYLILAPNAPDKFQIEMKIREVENRGR